MVKTGADCKHYPEKKRATWGYVEPDGEHKYTVLYFHGHGGSPGEAKNQFVKHEGFAYAPNQRVVLPQARRYYTQGAKSDAPSWFNFMATHSRFITPKWKQMKKDNDHGGQGVYMTSAITQSTLNDAVNFFYKTYNEELCKLYRSTGKLLPRRIIVGGQSQGCLLSTAALMRQNEFMDKPFGGVYGFIGVVPSLFRNPSECKTGPNSEPCPPTEAQKNFLHRTPAWYMWGSKDPFYPDHINRITWNTIKKAYEGVDKRLLTTYEVKGRGHSTLESDWANMAKWMKAVRGYWDAHQNLVEISETNEQNLEEIPDEDPVDQASDLFEMVKNLPDEDL